MSLLDQSQDALSSAFQGEGAGAQGLAQAFMANKALKFQKQEGLGQLVGMPLGYELEKQRIKSLMPQQQVQDDSQHGPSLMLGSVLRHLYNHFLPFSQTGEVTSYNMEPQ